VLKYKYNDNYVLGFHSEVRNFYDLQKGSNNIKIKKFPFSLGARSNQELTVEIMNETLRYVAFLTNLTTNSRYDLSVAAFVESHLKSGKYYKSQSSPNRRVYVDLECDPHQAFSKVPYEIRDLDAGIMVGIIATVSILVAIILIFLVCK
jgi:hypothetical protein